MKMAHAVTVLVILALIVGLLAGMASANAPQKGMATKSPGMKYFTTKDMSDKSYRIPRASAIPTPVITIRPSLRAKVPGAVKHMKVNIRIGSFGGSPTPPKATATISPTAPLKPMPGNYQPRFPGEPGYKG